MKILIVLFVFMAFIGCKLKLINAIPINEKEKLTHHDVDTYINIIREKEKAKLLKNPYLKINELYVERKGDIYTFIIFTEEEQFCISKYKMTDKFKETDSISVTVPIRGHYQLYTNKQIRINYSENNAYRGYYIKLDKGCIDGNTVKMRKTAVARKKNNYKKRLLSFYLPKRRDFVYQPNFKLTNIQTYNNLKLFRVEGVFKTIDTLNSYRKKINNVTLKK